LKKLKRLFVIVLALLFASCKSLPEDAQSSVKAIDLIDSASSFYLSIPKKVDEDLVTRIIRSNVEQLSDDDIKALAQRVNHLYIGISRSNYKNVLQASIESDVPVKYVPRLLSSKNGWTKTSFNPVNSKNQYEIYSQNKLNVAFPSDNHIVLGRDVNGMLSTYDVIRNSSEEEGQDGYFSSLDKQIYDWLGGSREEIRFFTVQPSTYLHVLLGNNLNLQLLSVWGAFRQNPKSKDSYLLDLTFNFKNEAYKKASKTILMIAFGLTDSSSNADSPTILEISDIELSKKQIYKILAL
jgi:hypothetical protein